MCTESIQSGETLESSEPEPQRPGLGYREPPVPVTETTSSPPPVTCPLTPQDPLKLRNPLRLDGL